MRVSDGDVGQAVTLARADAGVSQAELARRLAERGVEGMYASTIAKIERGQRSLKLNEAKELADALGVDLDRFLQTDREHWLPDRRFKYLAEAVLRAYEDAALSHAALLEMREIFNLMTVDAIGNPVSEDVIPWLAMAEAATPESLPARAEVLLAHGRVGQTEAAPRAFTVKWGEMGEDQAGPKMLVKGPADADFRELDHSRRDLPREWLKALQEVAEVVLAPEADDGKR